VIPGGVDVHAHLDMLFGGTTSADDLKLALAPPPTLRENE
jgi:hypothetical protein